MPKATEAEIRASPGRFDRLGRRRNHTSKTWWTKERTLGALLLFWRNHEGYAPLSTEAWEAATSFHGSLAARKRLYPSHNPILRYWTSFREAWKEVESRYGVAIKGLNRYWEPWSADEEWFVFESAGLIPRAEVAKLLGRSEAGIKRRLYDYGIDTKLKSRHGWSVNKIIQHVPGATSWSVRDQLARGEIPYVQGNVCIYVDPADLVGALDGVDWNKPRISEELEQAIRYSLTRRMLCLVQGKHWRDGLPCRARPTLPKRTSTPTHLAAGDVVVVGNSDHYRKGLTNRVGAIDRIYWSNTGYSRGVFAKPNSTPQWMVIVEFKKKKAHGKSSTAVRYAVPLTAVSRTEEAKAA